MRRASGAKRTLLLRPPWGGPFFMARPRALEPTASVRHGARLRNRTVPVQEEEPARELRPAQRDGERRAQILDGVHVEQRAHLLRQVGEITLSGRVLPVS